MWGPQGDPNKERPRLKPGDRLADGSVFLGNDPTSVLEMRLKQILMAMQPLEAQRDELLAKLAEVAPEKYGPEAVAPAATAPGAAATTTTTTPAPNSKPKAKRGSAAGSGNDPA